MSAPKIENNLSRHERKLVAEIRQLKSRLAHFEQNELRRKPVAHGPQENGTSFCTLFDNMAQGVFYQMPDGHIRKANRAMLDIFGLTLDQLQGRTSMTHAWQVIREDGSEFPGETHPSWLALKTGKEVRNVTAGIFNPQKNDFVWVNINAIPEFRAGQNTPYQVFVTMHDITERKKAEANLTDSEKRSRAWLEHSPVCTKTVDLDFNLQYMSTAGIRGLGIDDITPFYGKPYPFDFYPESFRKRMTENLERVKKTGEIITQEAPVADMEGNELWFHSTLVPVKDNEGRIEYIIVVSMDTTERRRAEQQIIENQAQLKSLASELVLAEERERNRIAVHMHDDVCQNLAYSKMKLQMLHAALDNQVQLDDVTEVTETLTRMMQDVHSLTFELSTPVLTEVGLEAAVANWLEKQVEEKHAIATEFTDDRQAKPLEEDIQALLFRSIRELLANVVKHSQANRVKIAMSRCEGQILVRLEDNGIGFALDKVVTGRGTGAGGYGLFSIRERLSQFGGSLIIESEPGHGCKATLRAPLQEA